MVAFIFFFPGGEEGACHQIDSPHVTLCWFVDKAPRPFL